MPIHAVIPKTSLDTKQVIEEDWSEAPEWGRSSGEKRWTSARKGGDHDQDGFIRIWLTDSLQAA